jgi:hypothetical protein
VKFLKNGIVHKNDVFVIVAGVLTFSEALPSG